MARYRKKKGAAWWRRSAMRAVTLSISAPEHALYILGDEVRLEQVFVNLSSNAIQAMTDAADRELQIRLSADRNEVTIAIRDSGPGILAGDLDKIFEPFFTTKDSIGLGLGMSISQRIIESMQGRLKVDNHHAGGAEFVIILPLQALVYQK